MKHALPRAASKVRRGGHQGAYVSPHTTAALPRLTRHGRPGGACRRAELAGCCCGPFLVQQHETGPVARHVRPYRVAIITNAGADLKACVPARLPFPVHLAIARRNRRLLPPYSGRLREALIRSLKLLNCDLERADARVTGSQNSPGAVAATKRALIFVQRRVCRGRTSRRVRICTSAQRAFVRRRSVPSSSCSAEVHRRA